MAEKKVTVFPVQCFHSEELGIEIPAHIPMEVRSDLAEKWIEEGKAKPVHQAAAVETPEDAIAEHETADKRKKK